MSSRNEGTSEGGRGKGTRLRVRAPSSAMPRACRQVKKRLRWRRSERSRQSSIAARCARRSGETMAAGGPTPGSRPASCSASAWVAPGRRRSAGPSRSMTRTPIRSALSVRTRASGSSPAAPPSGTAVMSGGRYLHAPDVHQRRGLRGRRYHGRFPRPGGLLRPDRAPGAPLGGGPDRGRPGAGGSPAGHHRGRGAGGGKLRGVRGDRRPGACGAGPGNDPVGWNCRVRPGARSGLPPGGRSPARDPGRGGRGARHPAGEIGTGRGRGDRPLHAGDREVPRREDGHGSEAGGAAEMESCAHRTRSPFTVHRSRLV